MFVPECHVDTALTQSLLSDRLKFINHKHGITQVANALKNQAELGRGPRFVVGMVDKDKKFADVKYLRNFTHEIASHAGPNSCHRIYQNPQQPSRFLIVMEAGV